jgi:hypothetical protein
LVQAYFIPVVSILLIPIPSGLPLNLQKHHQVYYCSVKLYGLEMHCLHMFTVLSILMYNRWVSCFGNPKNNLPVPISHHLVWSHCSEAFWDISSPLLWLKPWVCVWTICHCWPQKSCNSSLTGC